MKDNRVQFRLNPKKPRHERALEKLNNSEQDVKEYIIDAILAYGEAGSGQSIDDRQLRQIIREELKGAMLPMQTVVGDDVENLVSNNRTQEQEQNGEVVEIDHDAEDDDVTNAMGMLSAFGELGGE